MKPVLTAALLAAALSACASVPAATGAAVSVPQRADPYFEAGLAHVAAQPGAPRARNVIIFVGDGMGVTTVTATRIFAGQRQGKDGESHTLAMDTFPHVALSRTYGHDSQISDSAPTATALLSGVKTREGVIGLTSAAPRGVCGDPATGAADSIFALAEGRGLATGIVSTARITHATPAAAYAHAANRDWENDATLARLNGGACTDIARQLVAWPRGDGLDLALGGGRMNFLPSTMADPENADLRGARTDGRDLTAEWRAKSPSHVFVWNTAQLNDAAPDARILGLFSPDHMAYDSKRGADVGGEPSLAELTTTAIKRLARDPDGYVLLVEAGRIDHAHHEGRAGEALSDAVAFDDAIRAALDNTDRADTLIIVTADHSHTLTMAGYAKRGNPILGLSVDEAGPALGLDGRPYTTLGYANGSGSVFAPAQPGQAPPATARPDLSGVDTQSLAFKAQALVPLRFETHGGEDVAIYAWGPGDDAVGGTMEQNAVFHVMARALGFRFR